MINKIRKAILLITTILFACHLQVAGKEFFVSEQSIPDFKFIFDKLSQNRITYNRYNGQHLQHPQPRRMGKILYD